MRVIESDADFRKAIREGVTIALFGAEWCTACDGPKRLLQDDPRAIYADVEDCPLSANVYAVRSLPTIMVFSDGDLVALTVGQVTQGDVEKMVRDG